MGSFPAFLAAWGPIDYSLGSGQGVKCVHSEHLYGEFWHRGFTVCADTVHTRYIISCGTNSEVSGGVCAVRRHADARIRGVKRVQIEPHLSVTAACSAEWVPIKPKTDPAFMFSLVHVLLFEHDRGTLDLVFLRDRTAAPYLVGPDGYYLRDPTSGKPLLWDAASNAAVPFDRPDAQPALEGRFTVADAVRHGPDGERRWQRDAAARTAFTAMADAVRAYTPGMGRRHLRHSGGNHSPHRRGIFGKRLRRRNDRDRWRNTAVPPGGDHPRQDRQQRLGRL